MDNRFIGEKMTLRQFIEDAFTGLEAAIVLVAFIIVAAGFAYVILGTGFMTTQKTQEVVHSGVVATSSTLQLAGDVYGISPDYNTVDMINFSVSLAPGGSAIDFNTVAITYSTESNLETLTPVTGLRSTSTTPGTWAIIDVGGESGAENNLLEKGEQFTLSAHPVTGASPDSVMTVEVKPGIGSAISIKRTIPAGLKVVNILQ